MKIPQDLAFRDIDRNSWGYHAFWVEGFEKACDSMKKFLSQ